MQSGSRADEGDGVLEVLDSEVVAVKHLSVDAEVEGFGTGHLNNGALPVLHDLLGFGTMDVGTLAVVVDEADKTQERHFLEEVDFYQSVVVLG